MRRNHAYFWYPVNAAAGLPVAFQVDSPTARVAMELNSVEGKSGTLDRSLIEVRQSWKK